MMVRPTNRTTSPPLLLLLTSTSILVAAMLMSTVSAQLATTRVLSETGSGETMLLFRDANYSSWEHENVTYRSSTGYNAKGMAPLYKIANQVISLFVGKTVLPEGEWTGGEILRLFFLLLLVVVRCHKHIKYDTCESCCVFYV